MTRSRRTLQGVVLGAPIVAFALAGWAHRWTFDDGFIYLRIVRQIRVGNGPVFNTGERVEAFTSPLWVGVLAVSDLLTPLRLEWIAALLGIGFSVLGASLAVAGAARLVRREAQHEFLVPVGILIFVALLPSWYFETSGLETGLVFAWIGACLWVLANWATSTDKPLSIAAAVLLGVGWLVRPELVLDSIVFLVVVSLGQWRNSTNRMRASLVMSMIAVPLAYQVFRMGYFGSVVANTAVAKEGSLLRFDTGWSYLLDFVEPYLLWIPIALLVVGAYLPLVARLLTRGETRAACVVVAFSIVGFLNAGAVVAFGGDYVHGRLLLPALFALCAPVAVVPVAPRYLAAVGVGVWAVVCALGLRPPHLDSPSGLAFRNGVGYVVPHGTIGRVENNVSPTLLASLDSPALFVVDNTSGFGSHYVRPDAPPARDLRLPTVVTGGIGALGYALGPRVSILDLNGLADPLGGHLELVRRGQPGHEKTLSPSWIAAMVTEEDTHPRAEDFAIRPSASTPPAPGLSFPQEVMWARAALQCPEIADLRRSGEGALTPRKILSNVRHSFSRAQRRVPSDPREAYRRFCGDAAPAFVVMD